jgi:hypothetical protein
LHNQTGQAFSLFSEAWPNQQFPLVQDRLFLNYQGDGGIGAGELAASHGDGGIGAQVLAANQGDGGIGAQVFASA